MTGRRSAVIAGVGETSFARNSELSAPELMSEAVDLALVDAGLGHRDVQGLSIGTMSLADDSPYLAEQLGFELDWVIKADYGGAGAVMGVIRAMHAVEAGYVDTVVCVGGANRTPDFDFDVVKPRGDYSRRNFVDPLGHGGPNSYFGLVQRRHMYEFGTTLSQLGKIATTQRSHASLNPNALFRDPMSLDDYVNSRLIADPIRLFDCVMPCCGAGAIVVTSNDTSGRLGKKAPVRIARAAERTGQHGGRAMADRLTTGMQPVSQRVFSDYDRQSLDFLQIYDDYPIAVLLQLEDLGFAVKGGGGKFVEETDISIGGDLPINTGGGQLSAGQPAGVGGYQHVIEAVRQLRGEAGPRQVNDAKAGLVTGIGLVAYEANIVSSACLILEGEDQ